MISGKVRERYMGEISIIQAFEDPKIFGSLIRDQKTWVNWKVVLKSIFALPMNKKELLPFRQYTGRHKAPHKQFKEVFAIVGRRGGKSFISAVIACFIALFHDWKHYLAPGELGWIMVIASDRMQARVILGYVKGILRLPIFNGMVEKDLTWEVYLKNKIIISVKTCDYRTLRGYTVVAAILDELSFWRSEGANPAAEILTAIRPALATVPGSLLLGISTPYAKTGPLYEAFRDSYGRNDPDVLVWRAPTKVMNPTIQERIIDKALKNDYSAAKAEWLAEFREDLETFLPTKMIEDAVIPGRWELPKIEGVYYKAFCDPSGGRNDSFTLAIAHKEKDSKRIILDRLEEQRPPFNPKAVVKEYSKILKEYGIHSIIGDKYAGEWVSSSFKEERITYESSKLNRSELYLEFEPLMAQQAIDLLDNRKLINQLKSLERRTRSIGKDSVDHAPGLHDDLSNAAAGACVMAASKPTIEPRIWRV